MRYTPFETMEQMLDEMRRELTDWRESASGWSGDAFERPERELNADLTEHGDEYVVAIDMPGFEGEEIDLALDDGHLSVSAVRRTSDDGRSRARSVSERIALPTERVGDDASASYRDGVLEVHLPIAADAAERGHRIDFDRARGFLSPD